jgi:hypothetical protein
MGHPGSLLGRIKKAPKGLKALVPASQEFADSPRALGRAATDAEGKVAKLIKVG